MSRIIFDIETAGKDFDCLEPAVQEYLLRWADTEGERQEVKESLSFYPLTAEIAAIGMYDPDKNKGFIYFQNNANPLLPFEEEDMRYETGTEQEIIGKFWETLRGYKQFITFNGRALTVRSSWYGQPCIRSTGDDEFGIVRIIGALNAIISRQSRVGVYLRTSL